MAVLHGYHSTNGGHALYSDEAWCDFVALNVGHANSNDGSNDAQDVTYWTGVYANTNSLPVLVTEAHYAHLNENSEDGTLGPAPTAVGMRADIDGIIANEPGTRLSGVVYSDWYRRSFCDPADTLKNDNALADGYYEGVKTTRYPSGTAGATYATVANALGNDGESEYLESMGILVDPGGVTVVDGGDIQAAIDTVPNFGTVTLTADVIYDNVQLDIPAGKTVTLQGTGEWDSTLDTGNLLMGGELVTGFVEDQRPEYAGFWRASWDGTPIQQLLGNSENYNVWSRARDRLTCTLDEDWLHHAQNLASMSAGVPTNMTGHGGQYWFDYNNQVLWVDFDPTGKRVALSTVNRVVSGGGTLLIKDLSIGLSRSTTQEGMIRPEGDDWLLDGVEIFASHGVGIQSKGNRTHLIDCHIHHNGQLGLGDSSLVTNPSGVDNTSGGVLEESILEYNNMCWYKPGWEAGATKVAWHDDYVFRHNEVRFNYGFGLWDDINCVNPQYRFNYVHENWGPGIHHEIGMAAVVEFNRCEENGTWPSRTIGTFPLQAQGGAGWDSHPGIMVSESNGLLDRPGGGGYGIIVRNNLVYDNRGGIFLRQIDRDGDYSAPGEDAYWNKGISVLNNDVWWDDTVGNWPNATGAPRHGMGNVHATHDPFAAASSNAFDGNDYTINGTESTPANGLFAWDGDKSFANWQAAGQDADTSGRAASPEDFGITVTPPTTEGDDGYFLFVAPADTDNSPQFIGTPDSVALSASSSVRVEALVAADDYTPTAFRTIVGQYGYLTDDAGWRVVFKSDDTTGVQTSQTGDTPGSKYEGFAATPAGWVDGTQEWIAIQINAAAGLWIVEESTNGELWSSVGSGTVAPHTIYDGSGPIEIGRSGAGTPRNQFEGKMFAVRIFIDGVKVADPDFRSNVQAIGGSWLNGGVDSFGNVWTPNGGLAYVPATNANQELVMGDYGFPASMTIASDYTGYMNHDVTIAAAGAFTLVGNAPSVIVDTPTGSPQFVAFADPFQFTLAGEFGRYSQNQSVSPLSTPAAFTLVSSGPEVVAEDDPVYAPDPLDASLALQYGFVARYEAPSVDGPESYIEIPGTVTYRERSSTFEDRLYSEFLHSAPTSSVEVILDLYAPAWDKSSYDSTPYLMTVGSISGAGTAQRGYGVYMKDDALYFDWYDTSNNYSLVNSGTPVPLDPGIRAQVRVQFDLNDGGQRKAYFYTRWDDAQTWTQFGSTQTGAVTTIREPKGRSTFLTSGTGVNYVQGGRLYRAWVNVDGASALVADCTDLSPVQSAFITETNHLVWWSGQSFVSGPEASRLVLVPMGRSQHIGVKLGEGFEQVSDVFTWLAGTEDGVMGSLTSTMLQISESRSVVEATVHESLRSLQFRRPDGSELT